MEVCDLATASTSTRNKQSQYGFASMQMLSWAARNFGKMPAIAFFSLSFLLRRKSAPYRGVPLIRSAVSCRLFST
jgi:hypothetical protein